jgi:hypothetical protein
LFVCLSVCLFVCLFVYVLSEEPFNHLLFMHSPSHGSLCCWNEDHNSSAQSLQTLIPFLTSPFLFQAPLTSFVLLSYRLVYLFSSSHLVLSLLTSSSHLPYLLSPPLPPLTFFYLVGVDCYVMLGRGLGDTPNLSEAAFHGARYLHFFIFFCSSLFPPPRFFLFLFLHFLFFLFLLHLFDRI